MLPNIVEWYRNSSVQEKKKLIGSIFPEKFTFEKKNKARTTSIDGEIALILNYNGRFDENKNGTNENKSRLSHLVIPLGLEPRAHALKGRCSTN